jgi:hypothetical protein
MHHPLLAVDTDVRLQPEVPLFALLRLVHRGIALAAPVLGRQTDGSCSMGRCRRIR